ncbi:uncharacterized protein MELLADRAFT_107758 [Melampsora larici-populina 98AG31]|uniref:SYO1-like TPR repeats domain-containing protein n=1 Tax=Melampsora larici-populina (strain 98AG31 / pathotype 3-4-7) TaxID=747676 RepID=F4RQU9_MELLP|nr:uncharacterized protein MELLADRAFT_107758 [Melampsora larici-populina 98AG31]EGG05262.1 hypothetical protein MELLADRAFT_107758 [Melampsora larici-populina 98AG31]
MGKAQYKKRIRSARQQASTGPIQSNHQEQDQSQEPSNSISTTPSTTNETKLSKTKSKKSKPKQRDSSLAIIDHVRSETPADRVWSIAAISNLILSSSSTRRLLQSKNLVNLLIERLNTDQSHPQIMIETTSALRNLVIEGGDDVCGEMFNKGILIPLQALLLVWFNRFDGFLLHDLMIAENVLVILWSLAETSNKLFKAIGAITELVPFLFRIIQLYVDRLGISNAQDQTSTPSTSLTLVSIQCLYTLTEDDPKLIRQISSQLDPLLVLFKINQQPIKRSTEDQEELELLKVYLVGILRNIVSQTKHPNRLSFKSMYDDHLLPNHLFQFLDLDLSDLYHQASKAFLSLPPIPLSDLNLAKASVKAPSSEELLLESAERRLTTLQLSLELLGEWCATLDGFQTEEETNPNPEDLEAKDDMVEDDDEEDDDDDTEMREALVPDSTKKIDHDGDEEMGNGSETEDLVNPTALPIDQIPSNQFSKLFHSFMKLSQPIQTPDLPTHTIPTAAENGSQDDLMPQTIQELVIGIHTRALQSINNLLITLERTGSTSKILNDQDLDVAWKLVLQIVNGSSTSPLILPAVTCLWSLVRIDAVQLVLQRQSNSLIEGLLNLLDDEFVGVEVRSRLVSVLSVVGSCASITVEENQVIGMKLMEIISDSKTPLLVIHALDGVLDLYSDETSSYDVKVFRDLKFLNRLIDLVPMIKNLVKKIDKRKDFKFRSVAEDCLMNVLGFIEYRKGLKV